MLSPQHGGAAPALVVPLGAWWLLAGLLLLFVAIDLFAHRGDRIDSRRAAIGWSALWIAAALGFNLFVALHFGRPAGEQFLAAYLLEKSLSVDNLFVFLVIFGALGIPRSEQRRVLTWGILGALITRAAFIAAGAAALDRWHAVSYVFGGLLLLTAVKMMRPSDESSDSRLLLWLEEHVRWTRRLYGHRFFTREHGRLVATPLFLALLAIELTDVVFAVDSVPAAFAVTREPYIIYSSNVFAILGLRALYSVLVDGLAGLRYLRFGLAAVLAFAGGKMLVAGWVHVPPLLSVAIIGGCLGVAILASVWRRF